MHPVYLSVLTLSKPIFYETLNKRWRFILMPIINIKYLNTAWLLIAKTTEPVIYKAHPTWIIGKFDGFIISWINEADIVISI